MWIPFAGQAAKSATRWLLHPIEDEAIEIELGLPDVEVSGPAVRVRVGARAARFYVPKASPLNTKPQHRSEAKCASGKSRCAGGIEWCCDDTVSGKCDGRWNTCKPESPIKIEDVTKVGYRQLDTASSGR